MKEYLKENWKGLIYLALGLVLVFTFASFVIIQKNSSKIYGIDDTNLNQVTDDIKIGIVFGGAVGDSEPLPLVKSRLDTAKELLSQGHVDKLLLSGDNRSLDYNEPRVMYNYLLNAGVSPDDMQQDFAGNSTYETCERAKKTFNIHEAVLISEVSHLARAIYLCEKFGIESYGVSSDSNSGIRLGQYFRELFARDKAVLNIYFIGEKTVLGEPIQL